MSAIRNGDYLLVSKDETTYKIKVENLSLNFDIMVVNQDGTNYKVTDISNAEYSDYVLINRGGVNYKSRVSELAVYTDPPAGYWHLKNTGSQSLFLKGSRNSWLPDGTDVKMITEVLVGEERVVVCPTNETPLITSTGVNSNCNFEYGVKTDTRHITNLGQLHANMRYVNAPLLGNWDTSNVTNMNMMNNGASAFNQDLDHLDTSNVQDMGYAFYSAGQFNGDLSTWDVSNVTNMTRMFRDASVFNSDIGSWDTSSVTAYPGMDDMFNGATQFNQDISGWCVTNITFEPNRFAANGCPLSSANKPVWGTCP